MRRTKLFQILCYEILESIQPVLSWRKTIQQHIKFNWKVSETKTNTAAETLNIAKKPSKWILFYYETVECTFAFGLHDLRAHFHWVYHIHANLSKLAATFHSLFSLNINALAHFACAGPSMDGIGEGKKTFLRKCRLIIGNHLYQQQ